MVLVDLRVITLQQKRGGADQLDDKEESQDAPKSHFFVDRQGCKVPCCISYWRDAAVNEDISRDALKLEDALIESERGQGPDKWDDKQVLKNSSLCAELFDCSLAVLRWVIHFQFDDPRLSALSRNSPCLELNRRVFLGCSIYPTFWTSGPVLFMGWSRGPPRLWTRWPILFMSCCGCPRFWAHWTRWAGLLLCLRKFTWPWTLRLFLAYGKILFLWTSLWLF